MSFAVTKAHFEEYLDGDHVFLDVTEWTVTSETRGYYVKCAVDLLPDKTYGIWLEGTLYSSVAEYSPFALYTVSINDNMQTEIVYDMNSAYGSFVV